MNIINNSVVFEQIINKSRFICEVVNVSSVEEAKNKLKAIKTNHMDATHHCYAYIIGGNQAISKYSDDGEPANTAGSVIFSMLNRHELTNILAVVTRYYGGIKLGAGGLIRAYGSSVVKALDLAQITPLIAYIIVHLQFDYLYMNQIQKMVEKYEEINRDFDTKIHLFIKLPEVEFAQLSSQLIDFTKNTIQINKIEV